MPKLMIASAEKNEIRVFNDRLQVLVTWLHFLNFVTLAVICLLFLKLCKSLQHLYRWFFPVRQKYESPLILVIGPRNELVEQIVGQLSQTFNSEIIDCQDINDNSFGEVTPKQKQKQSQIIYSHVPVTSQDVVVGLSKYVQKCFGFVDILVISQNEEPTERRPPHSFINHLNKQLLVQFWTVMAFLPGMLRRNEGHVISVALNGSSLVNTGIMRSIQEELLQCNTKVKLTLVENNTALYNFLPPLPEAILARLIVRSIWNSGSVVKVPSLSGYLLILPLLITRYLMKPLLKIVNFASVRNS